MFCCRGDSSTTRNAHTHFPHHDEDAARGWDDGQLEGAHAHQPSTIAFGSTNMSTATDMLEEDKSSEEGVLVGATQASDGSSDGVELTSLDLKLLPASTRSDELNQDLDADVLKAVQAAPSEAAAEAAEAAEAADEEAKESDPAEAAPAEAAPAAVAPAEMQIEEATTSVV